MFTDWQYYKSVEFIDRDSICTLCLYRTTSLDVGDLIRYCHCQTDKERKKQKEIILIGIIGHLLFVFTLVQTPFITFKTTKKELLSIKSSFFVYPSRRLGISSSTTCGAYHRAQRAVHIISPLGAVSYHAPACILLRLADIQHCVLMIYRNKLRMIYKATP